MSTGNGHKYTRTDAVFNQATPIPSVYLSPSVNLLSTPLRLQTNTAFQLASGWTPFASTRFQFFPSGNTSALFSCRRYSTTTTAHYSKLTHTDSSGAASMVDVGQKSPSTRSAVAVATVILGPVVFDLVRGNQMKKGDVLSVARLAGIMGCKHTPLLIPLCHNIAISHSDVSMALNEQDNSVRIEATVSTSLAQTGVEMEALTAATVAALTVYDMCKAASKAIVISDVHLLSKTGGKSGDYFKPDS